jgi:hypothetical protein
MYPLSDRQMNQELERWRDHDVGVDWYPDDFVPDENKEDERVE